MKEFVIKYVAHWGIPKTINDKVGGAGGSGGAASKGVASNQKMCVIIKAKSATDAVNKIKDSHSCLISLEDISIV